MNMVCSGYRAVSENSVLKLQTGVMTVFLKWHTCFFLILRLGFMSALYTMIFQQPAVILFVYSRRVFRHHLASTRNITSLHTRILSRLMLAFLVRGTGGRGDETCFKGIGGSWDTWQAHGDLGNGGALESNTKLFRSQIWRRLGERWYPLSELLEITVESVWLVLQASTVGKLWQSTSKFRCFLGIFNCACAKL